MSTDPHTEFMNSGAWASELIAAYAGLGPEKEDQAVWMARGMMLLIGIHDARSRMAEGEKLTVTFDQMLAAGIRLAEEWDDQ